MPISLENKEREAASRLQNGEPGSMDRDKDRRPEHSLGIFTPFACHATDDVLDLMPAKSARYTFKEKGLSIFLGNSFIRTQSSLAEMWQ